MFTMSFPSSSRGSILSFAALPLFLASAASAACSGAAGTEGAAEETAAAVTHAPVEATTAAVPCEGGLPDICEVCADGKEACAHWVREDGKCEIQICPPASTAPIPVTSTTSGHPICDPDSQSPREGCHWDELECKWLCETSTTGSGPGSSTGGASGSGGSSTGSATTQVVIDPTKGVSSTVGCTGPLPDLCEVCADGSDGCAHWVIEDGKCEIQYCAPRVVCDPPGRAPNEDCRWDEQACVWLCL